MHTHPLLQTLEPRTLMSGTPFTADGEPTAVDTGTVRIEAEDFDTLNGGAFFLADSTLSNLGGAYRPFENVDIQKTRDTGGGFNVGWMTQGEFLRYTLDVAEAGTYRFDARAARTAFGSAELQIRTAVDNPDDASNSVQVGSVDIDRTGRWQAFDTYTTQLELDAGVQTLELRVGDPNAGPSGDGFTYAYNLNWFELTRELPVPEAPTFGNDGLAWTVDANGTTRIEAENFDTLDNLFALGESTLDNLGGAYRLFDGTDIEPTDDVGGGFNVGWTTLGETLQYTLFVERAGTYQLDGRFARPMQTETQTLVSTEEAGSLGSITVGSTGGWQSWQTFGTQIELDAGLQTLQLTVGDPASAPAPDGFRYAYNLNWFELTPLLGV